MDKPLKVYDENKMYNDDNYYLFNNKYLDIFKDKDYVLALPKINLDDFKFKLQEMITCPQKKTHDTLDEYNRMSTYIKNQINHSITLKYSLYEYIYASDPGVLSIMYILKQYLGLKNVNSQSILYFKIYSMIFKKKSNKQTTNEFAKQIFDNHKPKHLVEYMYSAEGNKNKVLNNNHTVI